MPRSPSRNTPAARNRRIRPLRGAASKGQHVHRATRGQVAAEWSEPNLIMLLANPEVRLLMQADRVDECELMATLNAISVQRSGGGERLKPDDMADNAEPRSDYRPGVGMVLLNARGDVFLARRRDIEEENWQMPQGGIKRGESPREAAMRELQEEIGTQNVDILAESNTWLFYDVPKELAERAWGTTFRGQRQKWFVMLFKGHDTEISVATEQAEFDAWRWTPPNELITLATSFKRQLYMNVIGEFPSVFRD
jgi:putative (di)nucleoside polyphosphate hydrolase